jgi:hypothetical protein
MIQRQIHWEEAAEQMMPPVAYVLVKLEPLFTLLIGLCYLQI